MSEASTVIEDADVGLTPPHAPHHSEDAVVAVTPPHDATTDPGTSPGPQQPLQQHHHHHHLQHHVGVHQGELINDVTILSDDKKAGEGGGYINMDAGGPPQQLLKGFSPLFAITQILGLVLVVLVAVWCGQKGLAWRSAPGLEFNWHPLLMIIGLIYLNGNAILTFRVLRNKRKVLLKYVHGGIQLITLPLVVIALVAVFDSHNIPVPPTPNMYSLHSWIGLGAVILFFSQWLIGLMAFLFPGLSAEVRSFLLPYHVYNGVAIFALSVAASLIGLNEKAFFTFSNNYGSLPGEAVLMNMIGVIMVLFALLVGLLVTKAEYKRSPLPEDGSPLLAPQRK